MLNTELIKLHVGLMMDYIMRPYLGKTATLRTVCDIAQTWHDFELEFKRFAAELGEPADVAAWSAQLDFDLHQDVLRQLAARSRGCELP